MSEDSIQLACDAGVPVVLAATRRASPMLEHLAEDLLVAGAEVEIVSDVEHAPCRFGEALVRLERPAVIALCHTEDDVGLEGARAMIAAEQVERHVLVECKLASQRTAAAARTVLSAMRELMRGAAEPSLAEVIAEVRKRGEPITDTIVLPTPPPAPAPTRRRSPWALGASAAAMAAMAIVGIVLAADLPASGAAERDAMAAPAGAPIVAREPVAPPRPPTSRHALPPTPKPVPTPAPLPTLELAAQGPAADPPADDELALAIRRGRAIEAGPLVVHLVAGDRDWYHAMDTCRARGFWRTSGWRVPSVAELRAIARTRAFADLPAWSNRRGVADATTAIAVSLVGGASETVDKHSTDIATICVKERA